MLKLFCSIILLLFFLCLGSFCNVLIYRIPKKEQFVKGRSYCPACKHTLAWYDNIPILAYIELKGRCRYCHSKISLQYPIVESLVMGLSSLVAIYQLNTIDFLSKPILIMSPILFGLVTSILIVLSVIDLQTFEIPMSLNVTLFIIGIFVTILQGNYLDHIIGMICVSGFLLLVLLLTQGKGIGFGDVKLMFACGLIVGWKSIIIGFLIGCILTIIIHPLRMKLSNQSHMLAFGPYLSAGVYISFFCGDLILNSYINWLNSLLV